MKYQKQVAEGSAWLDRVAPGWFEKVDINLLNLGSFRNCSLGQTFGEMASINLCASGEFAVSHGFDIPLYPIIKKSLFGMKKRTVTISHSSRLKEKEFEFKKLTGVWIQEILRRIAAQREIKSAIQRVENKI